jgi:hypothetical protein
MALGGWVCCYGGSADVRSDVGLSVAAGGLRVGLALLPEVAAHG